MTETLGPLQPVVGGRVQAHPQVLICRKSGQKSRQTFWLLFSKTEHVKEKMCWDFFRASSGIFGRKPFAPPKICLLLYLSLTVGLNEKPDLDPSFARAGSTYFKVLTDTQQLLSMQKLEIARDIEVSPTAAFSYWWALPLIVWLLNVPRAKAFLRITATPHKIVRNFLACTLLTQHSLL